VRKPRRPSPSPTPAGAPKESLPFGEVKAEAREADVVPEPLHPVLEVLAHKLLRVVDVGNALEHAARAGRALNQHEEQCTTSSTTAAAKSLIIPLTPPSPPLSISPSPLPFRLSRW